MDNLTERRHENKLLDFQDRRHIELRDAADRHDRDGHPIWAMLYRQDAYLLEHPEDETGKGITR